MQQRKKQPRESVVMGLAAMLFFILWGLLVNWQYGMGARLQVGFTQGAISLVSTLFSAELIRWLVIKNREVRGRVLIAGLMGWLIIYSLIALAHTIAGTPEVWATILPGLIIGIFFSFGYAYRISESLKSEKVRLTKE